MQKVRENTGKLALKKAKSPDENKTQKMSQKFLARQEKIKAVALKMFITKGYENTNINDIIKKSGGSLSNIYATFKNKEDLFVSVINDYLEQRYIEYGKILKKNLPLRDTLYTFSLYVMNLFTDKETLALAKVIYSQLYKQLDHTLIEHFRQNKEKAIESVLSEYFKTCPPPLCDNAEKYGDLFFSIIKNKCLEKAFFKIHFDKKEQEEYAKFIVDFFIKALQ